jgi:hypothetical protein
MIVALPMAEAAVPSILANPSNYELADMDRLPINLSVAVAVSVEAGPPR